MMFSVKKVSNISSVVLIACFSFDVLAHDTKVTHPVISLEAVRLIEKNDKDIGEFTELYRSTSEEGIFANEKFPLFWGAWNAVDESGAWLPDESNINKKRLYENMIAADTDEDDGFLHSLFTTPYSALYAINDMTIISGVVREDHPFTKVLNHFYHAYSTSPLTISTIELGDNSKTRALSFLTRSVNQYGYEIGQDVSDDKWLDDWYDIDEELKNSIKAKGGESNKVYFAKQLAFQTFGEALHHVEDMSSIAHVQNDGHLIFSAKELDDYEGHYLPNKVFQYYNAGPDGHLSTVDDNWFLNAENVATVNSEKDIWPDKQNVINWDSNSLAHKVYNASVFQGRLQPDGINTPASDDISSDGELHDMFSYEVIDENGDTTKRGLVHDTRSFYQFAVWTIEGVGDYHYKTFWLSNNDWWPTEKFDGPEGFYYIEQKTGDSFRGDESDFVVAPGGFRKDLVKEFSGENTLQAGEDDTKKLLTKFADKLVPLAIEYSAGFSAYWYNTVNSPPYLKAVKVKQQVIPVKQADGSIAEFDFTAYDAQWKNGHAFLNNFQDLIDTQVGYVEKAIFTAKRKLFKKQQTSPLYHNQNIDFYLSFSEPIKRPLDANSGFELGFKLVSARGELPVSEQTIMLDMSTEVVEIIDLDDSSNPRVLAIRDEFPEYKVFDQHMKGSRWLITVDGSKIADIEGLYGAVRLVVKAKDKNQHDSVLGGADLDDKPRTPARMKATLEGSGGTLKPIFKWYDGEEALTAEFAGSKESNDTPITPQHFSYDRKNGDQNHILWFSPKVTDADLIKQINNNSGQGYDDVSITGMPKEDVKK